MSHDPLCAKTEYPEVVDWPCECVLIAKVRADEQERNKAEVEATAKWCREDERFTLRAKVEAMPARGVVYPYDLNSLVPETLLYRADVLALLDGSTDE